MFYPFEIIRHRDSFGLVWLAAMYPKAMTERKYNLVDIVKSSSNLISIIVHKKYNAIPRSRTQFSLKLSSNLLAGLLQTYKKKMDYLIRDAIRLRCEINCPQPLIRLTLVNSDDDDDVDDYRRKKKKKTKRNSKSNVTMSEPDLNQLALMLDTFNDPEEMNLDDEQQATNVETFPLDFNGLPIFAVPPPCTVPSEQITMVEVNEFPSRFYNEDFISSNPFDIDYIPSHDEQDQNASEIINTNIETGDLDPVPELPHDEQPHDEQPHVEQPEVTPTKQIPVVSTRPIITSPIINPPTPEIPTTPRRIPSSSPTLSSPSTSSPVDRPIKKRRRVNVFSIHTQISQNDIRQNIAHFKSAPESHVQFTPNRNKTVDELFRLPGRSGPMPAAIANIWKRMRTLPQPNLPDHAFRPYEKDIRDPVTPSHSVISAQGGRDTSTGDSSKRPSINQSNISNISSTIPKKVFPTIAKTKSTVEHKRPEVEPAVPDMEPAVPDVEPAAPEVEPTVPDMEPAAPDVEPTVPDMEPTVPDVKVPPIDSTYSTTQSECLFSPLSIVSSLKTNYSDSGRASSKHAFEQFCKCFDEKKNYATLDDMLPIPETKRKDAAIMFNSLLSLHKYGKVRLEQKEAHGEIRVYKGIDVDEASSDSQY